jgi:hypothetical protein
MPVMIDSDPPAAEVSEVATKAAADIEDETESQSLQVPTVWSLDIKEALPPRFQADQMLGIVMLFSYHSHFMSGYLL